MKQFKKIALLCSLFLTTITGCAHKKQVAQKTIHVDKQKNDARKVKEITQSPHITVWVHGTRFDPISDLIHSVEKQGMHHATSLPTRYRLGSAIKTLAAHDPNRFPLEHFYVFGWSGKLSFEAREKEAHTLYQALGDLAKKYQKKYGQKPTIRLITHSHGGNLLLNMAKIQETPSFTIAQAILLACPVQHETKEYVSCELFDQVYSIYSTRDLIQVLDPQGLYLTSRNEQRQFKFSERTFPHTKNMRQAELKINGHGIGHAGFIFSDFAAVLPAIIDEMETWEPKNDTPKLLQVKTQ